MVGQSVPITEQITREMLDNIAQNDHCQAGATAALSAALAVSLGQATANGSLREGVNGEAAVAARNLQAQLTRIRAGLKALADSDAAAHAEFVRLRESGQAPVGYQVLCEGPQQIAELALKAAILLQDYREYVGGPRDDLEFAITLATAAARSAMQLLDSNLRIWPLPELLAKYDRQVVELSDRIDALTPVKRIRPAL